jgi:hypothetical protein
MRLLKPTSPVITCALPLDSVIAVCSPPGMTHGRQPPHQNSRMSRLFCSALIAKKRSSR